MRKRFLGVCLVFGIFFAVGVSADTIPSPSDFLGIQVGADRVLADYHQIRSYFAMLDEKSPRVKVETLGKTTLGEPMIMAIVSSEKNIANLDRIKAISHRLADPRGLDDAEAAHLLDEGKAVVLVTCNIHSTEIGSSQMAMEWAWGLATANDPTTLERLDNVVLLLVPSLNPDGQIMVTDWYRKYVGTKYEGGWMPWLYHHYVGHDNNRDWFMLTQKETREMTRAIYHEWFPQVFIDHHQMGSTGPRMFIPPFSDPIDPDINPLIWREIQLLGSNMAFRLEQSGRSGVIYGYAFDAYWLGGTRNTGWWKNITGLLTETASARIATPVFVHPTELQAGGKGLADYKPQTNYPNPWKGGWWRLRDIMSYQRIASDAMLETASRYRRDLLADLVARARAAIGSPSNRDAYRIPRDQRDYPTAKLLARLMADHGVDVLAAKNGDYWIPLAQPYSRFVREMMEPQRYPEIRLSRDDDILAPYDVSAWSLPLLMGVKVEHEGMPGGLRTEKVVAPILSDEPTHEKEIAPTEAPFYAIERTSPEAAKVVNAAFHAGGRIWVLNQPAEDIAQAPVPVVFPPGTFLTDPTGAKAALQESADTGVELTPVLRMPGNAEEIRNPRVGIYKPWAYPSMDEGWTRFLMDQYGFDAKSIDPKTMRGAANARKGSALHDQFDAIILPDITPDILASGKPKRSDRSMTYFAGYPPEYEGGLEKSGTDALRQFVYGGGTLIAFDASSDWVISQFNIPVTNALAGVSRDEFASPGALLRAKVDSGHPVTYGLPSEVAIFHESTRAFATTLPGADVSRWVLAWYPEDHRDILLSGWIRGAEKLERRAAAVALRVGKGKIVLFGFRPQNRAQTHGTFPFVFNSIWWSVSSHDGTPAVEAEASESVTLR